MVSSVEGENVRPRCKTPATGRRNALADDGESQFPSECLGVWLAATYMVCLSFFWNENNTYSGRTYPSLRLNENLLKCRNEMMGKETPGVK